MYWTTPPIIEAKPQTGPFTVRRGVRVWRLFFRGFSYTRAYPNEYGEDDVRMAVALGAEGELLAVEAVT